MATERVIFECPNGVCGPTLKAGPCFCGTRRGDRITYASREAVPVVPAVLSPETVKKVARAIDDEARGGLDGIRNEREDGLEGFAREALRAAGFVSEPSTGGEADA